MKKTREQLITPRTFRIPDQEPLLAALKKVSSDPAMEEHYYPPLLALAGKEVELHIVVRAMLHGRHAYLMKMKHVDDRTLPNETILTAMLRDPNIAKEAITGAAVGLDAANKAKDRRRASA